MIKAIFFDLDDTLLWDKKSIKEAFKATCEKAQKKYDLDPEKLEEAVRGEARQLYSSYETYPFTQMIGINPFEGLWGDFTDMINIQFRKMKEIAPKYRKEAWTNGLQALGIEDQELGHKLGELFPEFRRNLPFVYEDTFQVLDTLKAKYKLLLLTNGSPSLQTEKLVMTPKLIPYFDHIVISGNYGRGKPDPTIFEHALSLLSLNPKEAIMVGDNLNSDILGSNRAGIRNVWINREGMKAKEEIPASYEIKSLTELIPLIERLS